MVVVVLLIGGFIIYKSQSGKTSTIVEEVPTPTEALPTINSDTKVDLTFGPNNQSVAIQISGIESDVESVEYELTYITGSGLPRGVLGKITVNGQKEISRNDIVLGTCSSGKCVYDTGVKSVDLSLKFNTASSSKVFQKTYSL